MSMLWVNLLCLVTAWQLLLPFQRTEMCFFWSPRHIFVINSFDCLLATISNRQTNVCPLRLPQHILETSEDPHIWNKSFQQTETKSEWWWGTLSLEGLQTPRGGLIVRPAPAKWVEEICLMKPHASHPIQNAAIRWYCPLTLHPLMFMFPHIVAFISKFILPRVSLWSHILTGKQRNTHTQQPDSANPSEGCAHFPLSYALWSCEALFASILLNKEAPSTGNKQRSVASASAT